MCQFATMCSLLVISNIGFILEIETRDYHACNKIANAILWWKVLPRLKTYYVLGIEVNIKSGPAFMYANLCIFFFI